ncbi:MAG: DUF547 domain-containing protein [Leptospiraceae bacterium]|nr:DUF547 domain-containing protein [Leptospiraceae bacterium]
MKGVLALIFLLFTLHCSGLPERIYAPPKDGELLAVTDLGPLYASYSDLLGKYVDRGNVDYAKMCKDPTLERVMAGFRSVDPSTINTREQGLAFWINAYNAFTLDLICLGYPVDSINDLHGAGGIYTSTALGRTVWKIHKFPIGHKQYTLDEIEHEILRPKYNDYRIHAGIVCASVSCPLLRSEAFLPQRIDEQLDEQMQEFLASDIRNRLDPATRTIYLSKIFQWFADDFAGGGKPLLEVLWKYLPLDWKDELGSLENVRKKWKVEYLSYDWSLNGN